MGSEEEPQNMVKLVFKEKKGSNGETEVSSGQPQNDAFRSLSATVSPERLEEKNEDDVRLIEEKGVREEEEEEEAVVVDEETAEKELPSLNHLLTWAASTSSSNQLKLIRNVAELQAKLLDIHMK